MTDLSAMSDAELKAAYDAAKGGSTPAAPDLSKMSDAELKAAYEAAKAPAAAEAPSKAGDFFRSIPRGLLSGFSGAASALGQAEAPMSGIDPKEIPSGGEGTALMEKHLTGELHQPQTGAGQYGATVGEFLGNPATYVGPGGMLAKAGTAIGGALGSEAAGQYAKDTKYEPIARMIGAMAGGHAVAAAPRVITPLPASAERMAQVEALRTEGINPTAGQVTGSEALRRAENVAPSIPLGPKGTNDRILDQFGQAALSRAGIDASRATPEVMQDAANRLGAVYERVGSRNNMQLDQQVQNNLLGTVAEYAENARPPYLPTIENTMNEAATLAGRQGGHLTGQQYLTLRSRLRASARGESDPATKNTLNEMASHFDDAMERSITNPEDHGALAAANQHFRNLMVLERAASMGGEEGARGVITPGSLAAAVKGVEGRRAFVRGTGDLAELARNGQAILSKTNSSGTAENANILKWLSAESPIIGAIAGEQTGHTLGAAAAGFAIPTGAAHALMSRPVQGYLGNQRLPYRLDASPSMVALVNAIRGERQ